MSALSSPLPIATRKSPLALAQALEVQALLAKHGMPDAPVGRMLQESEVLDGGVTVAYRPVS